MDGTIRNCSASPARGVKRESPGHWEVGEGSPGIVILDSSGKGKKKIKGPDSAEKKGERVAEDP